MLHQVHEASSAALEVGFSFFQEGPGSLCKVFRELQGLACAPFDHENTLADIGFEAQTDGLHDFTLGYRCTGSQLLRQGLC